MNRYEKAVALHEAGFNCAQAVVGAYADRLKIDQRDVLSVAAGFGGGAGTGELCGAVAGAVMVLGLLHPVEMEDPVGSKKRTGALSRDFQARFAEEFHHLRCHDLLREPVQSGKAAMARNMGITNHCRVMIVTAVEILETLLAEQEDTGEM